MVVRSDPRFQEGPRLSVLEALKQELKEQTLTTETYRKVAAMAIAFFTDLLILTVSTSFITVALSTLVVPSILLVYIDHLREVQLLKEKQKATPIARRFPSQDKRARKKPNAVYKRNPNFSGCSSSPQSPKADV